MYSHWGTNALVVAVTAITVALVVVVHYKGLRWLLLHIPHAGQLGGVASTSFLDAIYLSAVTFSTVGFGDLVPVGPLRFLCGTEALAGFILITWSASFLYLEMEQFWRQRA